MKDGPHISRKNNKAAKAARPNRNAWRQDNTSAEMKNAAKVKMKMLWESSPKAPINPRSKIKTASRFLSKSFCFDEPGIQYSATQQYSATKNVASIYGRAVAANVVAGVSPECSDEQ